VTDNALFTKTLNYFQPLMDLRHSDSNAVQVSCFSPDSENLVTGSAAGSIALWSVPMKRQLK